MKVAVEIRPGEGGDDAKDLVKLMSRAYLKWADKAGHAVSIEEQDGL